MQASFKKACSVEFVQFGNLDAEVRNLDADVHNSLSSGERWGAGVETQKNVRGEVGGWGRVPFNEPCAPSLSSIYDGA